MECGCANNQSLRGAAVNAYITRFLARIKTEEPDEALFACRICGAKWQRDEREDSVRVQLIRIGKTPGKTEE